VKINKKKPVACRLVTVKATGRKDSAKCALIRGVPSLIGANIKKETRCKDNHKPHNGLSKRP